MEHGLIPRLHADEFEWSGGAEIAAEFDAASADHLGAISDAGISALAGFVIGIGSFIYIFVRLKAGLSHIGCAIYAGVFILLLGTLSHFMTLQYPEGILQSYLTLPWPLQ